MYWVQTPKGHRYYGTKVDGNEAEGAPSTINVHVGDPCFGFKATKKKVEVEHILSQNVQIQAGWCHNAVIILGTSKAGKSSLCEQMVNNQFLSSYSKTYAVTPSILTVQDPKCVSLYKKRDASPKGRETKNHRWKRYTVKLVDTVGSPSAIVSKESEDARLLGIVMHETIHGRKAYIIVIDMTDVHSLKKGYNLLNMLRDVEQKSPDREALPVVVFANKRDVAGLLNDSLRKKLTAGMMLVVDELQKRTPQRGAKRVNGILCYGSIRQDLVHFFHLATSDRDVLRYQVQNMFLRQDPPARLKGNSDFHKNVLKPMHSTRYRVVDIISKLTEIAKVDWKRVIHIEPSREATHATAASKDADEKDASQSPAEGQGPSQEAPTTEEKGGDDGRLASPSAESAATGKERSDCACILM